MTDPSGMESVFTKAKRRLSRGLGGASPVEVPAARAGMLPYEAERQGRRYKLFFMLGFPRSGTNWVGAIINRHPRAHIHGEYHFELLAKGFRNLWSQPWHAASGLPYRMIAEECLRESIRQILVEGARFRPEAEWIGDRTPRPMDVLIPGAPHFLVLRDPRDVLVSFLHHDLATGGFVYRLPGVKPKVDPLRERFLADDTLFKKDPALLMSCELYVRRAVNQIAFYADRNLEALEKAERGELDAPVQVVRYEALHADPEPERAKLYAFLGLDPAEALPLDEESRTKPGLTKEQPTGMFRKGQTGSWREHFTDESRRWFEEEIGRSSAALGYPADDW